MNGLVYAVICAVPCAVLVLVGISACMVSSMCSRVEDEWRYRITDAGREAVE
jgi:hypothetical protein